MIILRFCFSCVFWLYYNKIDFRMFVNSKCDILYMEILMYFDQFLEIFDNGKFYYVVFNVDFNLVIKCYRYYVGWVDKIEGKIVLVGKEIIIYLKIFFL